MVFETVRNAIAEQLEMDPETITMDSKLTEDLKTHTIGLERELIVMILSEICICR